VSERIHGGILPGGGSIQAAEDDPWIFLRPLGRLQAAGGDGTFERGKPAWADGGGDCGVEDAFKNAGVFYARLEELGAQTARAG